ncbi:hypothetical protein E2562_021793 [Oryza meyeriana var. granulata]|uniref:Uncharacterized protein n=1 Tax=Oryza meyeriana var. granulata TaxID=110450 RepID=A0A6G1EN76_9ORYZ|nr:hypothetical protein E2562_021793 [Oryza meyeriana var. granulata]KAF0926079.1 hypothetical protein E2562_021793 [Oryza meyeriana var. granulata]
MISGNVAVLNRHGCHLQGRQHLPVVCKGTESMQWAGQKRFFSVEVKAKDAKLMESAWSSVKRLMAWFDEQANPRNATIFFAIINVIYLGIFIRGCLTLDGYAKDCTTYRRCHGSYLQEMSWLLLMSLVSCPHCLECCVISSAFLHVVAIAYVRLLSIC